MPLDELEVPVIFELNEVSANCLEKPSSLLAPSIQKRRTVVIHNRKRKISRKSVQHEGSINTLLSNKAIIRSELEKLFEEK
ncbi:hypothetical protein C2G38_2197856 [Gigaspora rosea]|uniref:Uncharacterized protein n=1 Tax=Gigaspora rosea TaxID=44941 RepID=A0A397V280_9GLOM|nr:hypothetical protein C2G38_2197856 [Gigaspora rosea]